MSLPARIPLPQSHSSRSTEATLLSPRTGLLSQGRGCPSCAPARAASAGQMTVLKYHQKALTLYGNGTSSQAGSTLKKTSINRAALTANRSMSTPAMVVIPIGIPLRYQSLGRVPSVLSPIIFRLRPYHLFYTSSDPFPVKGHTVLLKVTRC